MENLAVAAGGFAEGAGRNPGRTMETAHEIGEIGEADIERDSRDGTLRIGQKPGCVTQARADKILMRRHAQHIREDAQKMKHAETAFPRDPAEIHVVARMRLDPVRRVHGPPAVARMDGGRFSRLAFDRFDETRRKDQRDFLDADIAFAAATDCASSPSTIIWGSGGMATPRQEAA